MTLLWLYSIFKVLQAWLFFSRTNLSRITKVTGYLAAGELRWLVDHLKCPCRREQPQVQQWQQEGGDPWRPRDREGRSQERSFAPGTGSRSPAHGSHGSVSSTATLPSPEIKSNNLIRLTLVSPSTTAWHSCFLREKTTPWAHSLLRTLSPAVMTRCQHAVSLHTSLSVTDSLERGRAAPGYYLHLTWQVRQVSNVLRCLLLVENNSNHWKSAYKCDIQSVTKSTWERPSWFCCDV